MLEKYEFNVGDGLDYDILDKSYNETTQRLILKNGLKPGMTVLDVGPGAGVMTAWLSQQVGDTGCVVALDESPEQLDVTRSTLKRLNVNNVKTMVHSAYDIGSLDKKFDVIYCRFLLHHLHSPRKVITSYYNALKQGGLYFGQEGIMHGIWAYPDTHAWRGYQLESPRPTDTTEGIDRDGDFGVKLLYACKDVGFEIMDCHLEQPLLWTKKQKQGLLSGLVAFKQTALKQGMTEAQWQDKYSETQRIINDDKQVVAFYSSCFVAACKRAAR